MTDQMPFSIVKPRLLNLQQVQQACGGIGRDLALQVMHGAGLIRLGRRIFVRPEDLDRYLQESHPELDVK